MTTGLFEDEEDGYNLEEETKYKLKLDAPKSEPAFGGSSGDELGDDNLDDFEDLGDEGDFGSEGDDKPFNDEPFDAGVEASEDEDPEKYIQQLSGKLGTSLRKYTEDLGQPDFELEKFAINSVISATNSSDMDEEDKKDIIDKINKSGNNDSMDLGDDADREMSVDSEEPSEEEPIDDLEALNEAEYQGKTVKLNKPMRGDVKKYKVYVKNEKGNVVKVNFGDKNMEIKRDDPERRKSFRARHKCDSPGPKTKARYWSCKMWSTKSVSDILSEEENMFSQNLNNMKMDIDKILSMDKDVIKGKLKNADWAKDHVSTSTDDTDEVTNFLTVEDDDPCWDSHEMIGMKDKGGKKVPNCVKKNEEVKSSRKNRMFEFKPTKKNNVVENEDTGTIDFNGNQVNLASLDIKYDITDYPDFADAYVDSGEYVDGNPMSDEELNAFQEDNVDLIHDLIIDNL
tara:strand:- start:9237 stop:10601 length:1365 start_codon:yes stop_codon:yes gene_type:complete